MLKSMLKLNGVKKLSKKSLSEIQGSVGYSVTCNFSDGTSWSGHTHDSDVANGMISHCGTSGGSSSSHVDVTGDYIAHHI